MEKFSWTEGKLCLKHEVITDVLYSQDVITHSNKFCPYVSQQLLPEW